MDLAFEYEEINGISGMACNEQLLQAGLRASTIFPGGL